MANKSKGDLVAYVNGVLGDSDAAAKRAVDAVLEGIEQLSMGNEKLILRGFGTFQQQHRRERQGRNPRTGEPMLVPASTKLGFKAAKN